MLIRKYLHSCILLEENSKKILIDPGAFSFVEKKLKPEDIGPVDVLLLTHKHPDHYFPEALKVIKATTIIANEEICALLTQEGLVAEVINEGETKTVAGFTIKALQAPHEPIPTECPHNLAFVINNKLLHPGDSFRTDAPCEVLFLPIAGPWCRLVDALEFAKTIGPKTTIPIHDGIIKEFMLERMYAMCKTKLSEKSIVFHPLALGESVTL